MICAVCGQKITPFDAWVWLAAKKRYYHAHCEKLMEARKHDKA
jgi:hypothetical protein